MTNIVETLKGIELQQFRNVKDYSSPFNTINLFDYYNEIRYSYTYLPIVNEARSKLTKEERDAYKTTSLPCTSFTFNYSKSRKKDAIIGVNQVIYIDIDKPEFNPDIHLDKSKVLMYYKTLSNKGYAIIVLTSGLTLNNYVDYYDSIINELNLNKFYDNKIVRYHIAMTMSQDEDIYVNEHPHIFTLNNNKNCTPFVEEKKNKVSEIGVQFTSTHTLNKTIQTSDLELNKCTPIVDVKKGVQIKENNSTITLDNQLEIIDNELNNDNYLDLLNCTPLVEERERKVSETGVQFNNFLSLDFGENDYIYSSTKDIEVITCNIIPNKIKKGNRNAVLSSYVNNLIYLNPYMTISGATSLSLNINRAIFFEPLSINEVQSIVNNKIKLRNTGKLTPIITKRMVVFSPNCRLSKDDKLSIVRSLLSSAAQEKSKAKIYNILENWNFDKYGKISIRSISNNYPISKKTVAKYYSEFKDYIITLNNNRVS